MKIKTKEEILQEIYSSPLISEMLDSLKDDAKKNEIMTTAEKALGDLYDSFVSFGQKIKDNPPSKLQEEIQKKFIVTVDSNSAGKTNGR